MKHQLSIVKFLTSVKVKEESNYCRDLDFDITLDTETNLVRVEEKRNVPVKAVSYVPIHNVSYYKLKEEPVSISVATAAVEKPAKTKK